MGDACAARMLATTRRIGRVPRRPADLAFVALFLAACSATGSPATTASITPTAIPRAGASPVPATAPLATIRATPTIEPVTPSPTIAPAPSPPPSPSPSKRPWSVVVVGDSVAYNHPKDCPGCTGVADRYAAAIERATGRDVALTNLSEYTGLRVEGLSAELRSDAARRSAIAGADFVLITIAHNNVVCPDWDLDRTACATLADQYRETYAQVFAAVVALRAGRATAFRTVNRYNDVTKPGTTEGEAAGSGLILDAWNEMVCAQARANGFLCADIYHSFNGSDGRTPSGDLLANDYTHPSDLGAERIADVLDALGYAPLGP